MNKFLSLSILGLISLLGLNSNLNNLVFGHTFSGDESASFLSKVEMIKIESQLAQQQLSNNISLAKAHADQTTQIFNENDTEEITERNSRLATELDETLRDFVTTFESESPLESEVNDKVSNITDVLSEVVSARIDNEQLNNVTVKALVVNDLVGEALEHYSVALGMEESAHGENEEHTSTANETEHGSNEEEHASTANETEHGSNETTKIVDGAQYQTAQGAVSRAIEVYDEIKSNENTNSTELGNSLTSLKGEIDNKSPFDEIDKIVDEKITPSLNTIFKLNLAEGEEAHAEEKEHEEEGGRDTDSSLENETHEADSD
jgi:hypothetical protein